MQGGTRTAVATMLALATVVVAAAGLRPGGTEAASAEVAPLTPGFSDTLVWEANLASPVDLAFAPDGRVFVAERRGTIVEFDSPGDKQPKVFADLRTQTYNIGDKGLLGLTVDPAFPQRPYLYALYSLDGPAGSTPPVYGDACPDPPGLTTDGCVSGARLSRLTWSPAGPVGTERILIEGWCHQGPSHGIGTVAFGPDGALYAGSGDGTDLTDNDWGQHGIPPNPCGDPPGGVGTALTLPTSEGGFFRAQDLRTPADPTTLDGAIIRVDPDTGAALPDNPLAGSADPNARRIVAHGFRNPFRFAFRPGTDELYVGDVGAGLWEEINRVPDAGDGVVDNFGWPCYEGAARKPKWEKRASDVCAALFAAPAGTVRAPRFQWSHDAEVVAGDGCPVGAGAATGVAFAPGGFPAEYQGAFFFADYARECLFVMSPDANGRPDPANVGTVYLMNNAGNAFAVSLYITGNIRVWRWNGAVWVQQ